MPVDSVKEMPNIGRSARHSWNKAVVFSGSRSWELAVEHWSNNDILKRSWWSVARAFVFDRLPPEVAAIIRLGCNFRISIVREGIRSFAVYYRGVRVADVSDVLDSRSAGGVRKRTALMVDRATWLADHWGVRYSRKRRDKR
jgi:hypothetical protein